MDKLTNLERELLKSVEQLASGSRQEVEDLRKSLTSYEMAVTEGIETRLSAVESRQARLESSLEFLIERLSALDSVLSSFVK